MTWQRVYVIWILLVLSSCWLFVDAQEQITHPDEVDALLAVRRKLKDTRRNLNNWKKSDPCSSNWTGVICAQSDDGYLHVQELRLLRMNLSGTLSPELGKLSHMTVLNVMWNDISGSIPKEIGSIAPLQLLLLSGNQLSGSIPDELGFLSNLTMIDLEQNFLSGPLPKSFANLKKAKHFHLNNNSISGQIPPELSELPELLHILLDNNNLTGYLPPELYKMPRLKILQLDNNNFQGTGIPVSYNNMSKLLKMSLRNCNLEGEIPDLSMIPGLMFLDLSFNGFTSSIPTNRLSENITTIDLSNNKLTGSIPSNFSGFPYLQKLMLENNELSGNVPSNIWVNINFSANATLSMDFRNNLLSNVSGSLNPPSNVTIRLEGNPVCSRANELNISEFCGLKNEDDEVYRSSNESTGCPAQSCPFSDNYEYVPESPVSCFCAAPLGVGILLRSPSMSNFRPYTSRYQAYLTSGLNLDLYQLSIGSYIWQRGPRLRIYVKIFPQHDNSSNKFDTREIQRIRDMIATFSIPASDIYGPYQLLNFTLLGPYADVQLEPLKSGISKGAVAGIVIGCIVCIIAIFLVVLFLFCKRKKGHQPLDSETQLATKIPIKTVTVKGFSFSELEEATNCFSVTCQVGRGGYGKVYKGTLANGTVVAIKRAQHGSLQGQKEFLTEIELLSRLHHRNLVSLLGYCVESGEQMLVYEYMPHGSLQDALSDASGKDYLSFSNRLHIALDAARGILYLHTEANPPIIHRDIKANNILLDYKFTAKVSDFGISRPVPVPNHRGAMGQVSTAVKGTPGYVDPEYFLTHILTEKSDVYSLGIVFLELLTGMQPIYRGRNIVREVNSACQSGMMISIIDKNMGPYSSQCLERFMTLALKCCEDETEARPSMLVVVRELENISNMLPPEHDTIPAETSDVSVSSDMSGVLASSSISSLYSRRNLYSSLNEAGSDLISGVIPTIKPR